MDTAFLTIALGFLIRLVVPFTLLLLLTRSLQRIAERLDKGTTH